MKFFHSYKIFLLLAITISSVYLLVPERGYALSSPTDKLGIKPQPLTSIFKTIQDVIEPANPYGLPIAIT